MSSSRTDRDVWFRATTLFGVALLISAGLCGINYVSFNLFGLARGGTSSSPARNTAGVVLVALGALELLGMLVGALGLCFSLLGLLTAVLLDRFKSGKP